MKIKVGEVIAVSGVKITLQIDEESNKETIFFKGKTHKGVSIRELISIERGFREIICLIEGEYLDENKISTVDNKSRYIRKVDIRPIGYFENNSFTEGIKFLPMIRDSAHLIPEEKVSAIFSRGATNGFNIGKMVKESVPVYLPWQKLFNSHIGIFGNTGSGKSNTLTKLYSEIFDRKSKSMVGKSQFVIIDFNGEYTGGQITNIEQMRKTFKLSTQDEGGDKFRLTANEFWDAETLSMLFKATPNTQRPFLDGVVNGRNLYGKGKNSLNLYIRSVYEAAFSTASPKGETLQILKDVARQTNALDLLQKLGTISWHGQARSFFIPGTGHFEANGARYRDELSELVEAIDATNLSAFEQLLVRCNLRLTRNLIQNHVQFEFIQPLLKRAEAALTDLKKVVEIIPEDAADNEAPLLAVFSLKKCKNSVKKILPLLIAKSYYNAHRLSLAKSPPEKTLHLIIDEAHNVLSEQSSREQETWRDYRLELFEEIIKEGRKFGVFLTISSQRPADISPTIVSQLHNFFLHRLVNERDLFLIDNTISTLDSLSRGMIPNLAKGCCVVTGTAFELPMVIQVDPLSKEKQPDSEDVDLEALWP